MLSAKTCLDAFCPPFLQGLKAKIQASPMAYRLARGAFWSVVGSLVSRALGLLAGILVARLLGKHDYGQLGMVQNTTGMFGIFAGFGMGLTANKHVAEFKLQDPTRAGRIIALSSVVSWVTGGVMTLAVVIAAPYLARTTLAAPEMSSLLQAGALLLLFGGINGAQTGALAGFEAFKTIARVNLISGLAAFPITLAGAWWAGVTGSIWALDVNLALNCIMNFIALRQEAARAGVPLTYRHCSREWRVLWQFSLPSVLGGGLTGPLIWAASALLVNQSDGYAQMGVYNAVARIKIVPEMLLNMLLAPLLPVLTERFASRDVLGFQKAARSAFLMALLMTVPFALLQIAVPALTLLPYGSSYAGHPGVVQWLMFELAVLGIFVPMSQVVASMNKMWFGFVCNLSWAILYGALAFLLVPRYGAVGLAASPILAHLVCIGPALWYIYHKERAFLAGLPLGRTALMLCCLAVLSYFVATHLPVYAAAVMVAVIIAFAMMLTMSQLRKQGAVGSNMVSIQ